MKRRWLGYVALLAALSLVFAACGDDDDATDDTTAETTATTEAATATTAAPATTEAVSDAPEVDYAFDVGVTPAPCSDAVNEGNACIYLGVISDLTVGPFAALGVPLTKAQEAKVATVLEQFDKPMRALFRDRRKARKLAKDAISRGDAKAANGGDGYNDHDNKVNKEKNAKEMFHSLGKLPRVNKPWPRMKLRKGSCLLQRP